MKYPSILLISMSLTSLGMIGCSNRTSVETSITHTFIISEEPNGTRIIGHKNIVSKSITENEDRNKGINISQQSAVIDLPILFIEKGRESASVILESEIDTQVFTAEKTERGFNIILKETNKSNTK